MVASTPFSYGITIDDYLDNPTTIITPTNVYELFHIKDKNKIYILYNNNYIKWLI